MFLIFFILKRGIAESYLIFIFNFSKISSLSESGSGACSVSSNCFGFILFCFVCLFLYLVIFLLKAGHIVLGKRNLGIHNCNERFYVYMTKS